MNRGEYSRDLVNEIRYLFPILDREDNVKRALGTCKDKDKRYDENAFRDVNIYFELKKFPKKSVEYAKLQILGKSCYFDSWLDMWYFNTIMDRKRIIEKGMRELGIEMWIR